MITLKIVAGVTIGAVLGYGYYYFIGCASGSCPLTSNAKIMVAYGALMGFLLSASGST